MCSRHVPPSPAPPLCVSDLGQVQRPTVHPLSSLVSNRHGTCPESSRREQSTVTVYQFQSQPFGILLTGGAASRSERLAIW